LIEHARVHERSLLIPQVYQFAFAAHVFFESDPFEKKGQVLIFCYVLLNRKEATNVFSNGMELWHTKNTIF
jgi:hypothetical protein